MIPRRFIQVHRLQMQSLRWSVAEQDRVSESLWNDRVSVYKPKNVHTTTALLWINGGTRNPRDNDDQGKGSSR